MSNYVVSGTVASDVAVAGTFTVTYPNATSILGQSQDIGGISTQSSKADFLYSFGHTMVVNQANLLVPDSVGLTFGNATTSTPGNITVTNKTAATWKAGSPYFLNLVSAKQIQFVTANNIALPHVTKLGGGRFKICLGNPVAKSTTAVLSTVAVASSVNVLTTQYDLVAVGVSPQGRGLQYVSSSASDTTTTILVTGLDIFGNVMTELATLNGTTPVLGLKGFSKINTILPSAAMIGNLSVGTTDLFSLPMMLPAPGLGYVVELVDGVVPGTPGTFVAGVQVAGGSLNTSGDVRGTYLPNTATNGSHVYEIIISTTNEDYLGQAQSII